MITLQSTWLQKDSVPTLYRVRKDVQQLMERGSKPNGLDHLKKKLAEIEAFTARAPEHVRWVENGWENFSPDLQRRLVSWAADERTGQSSTDHADEVSLLGRLVVRTWLLLNRRRLHHIVDRAEFAMCSIADEILHQDEMGSRSSDAMILKRLEQAERLFPTYNVEAKALGANAGDPVAR